MLATNGLSIAEVWKNHQLSVYCKFSKLAKSVQWKSSRLVNLWGAFPGQPSQLNKLLEETDNNKPLVSIWEPQPKGSGWQCRWLFEDCYSALGDLSAAYCSLYNPISHSLDLLFAHSLQPNRVYPNQKVAIADAWYNTIVQSAVMGRLYYNYNQDAFYNFRVRNKWFVAPNSSGLPADVTKATGRDTPTVWQWHLLKDTTQGWEIHQLKGSKLQDILCCIHKYRVFYNIIMHEYHLIGNYALSKPRLYRSPQNTFLCYIWSQRPMEANEQIQLFCLWDNNAEHYMWGLSLKKRQEVWPQLICKHGVQFLDNCKRPYVGEMGKDVNPTIWLWEPALVLNTNFGWQLRLATSLELTEIQGNLGVHKLFYNALTHVVEVATAESMVMVEHLPLIKSSISRTWKTCQARTCIATQRAMEHHDQVVGDPSRIDRLEARLATWSDTSSGRWSPEAPSNDNPEVWIWESTGVSPTLWRYCCLGDKEVHNIWNNQQQYSSIYSALKHRFEVILNKPLENDLDVFTAIDVNLLELENPPDFSHLPEFVGLGENDGMVPVESSKMEDIGHNNQDVAMNDLTHEDTIDLTHTDMIDLTCTDTIDLTQTHTIDLTDHNNSYETTGKPTDGFDTAQAGLHLAAVERCLSQMHWGRNLNIDDLCTLMISWGGFSLPRDGCEVPALVSDAEWDKIAGLWCAYNTNQHRCEVNPQAASEFTQMVATASTLNITRFDFIAHMSQWPDHPTFTVTSAQDLSANKSDVFIIQNLRDLYSFSVVVFDHTTVVQSLWMTHVTNCCQLVQKLVKRRIPCSTVVPLCHVARDEPLEEREKFIGGRSMCR